MKKEGYINVLKSVHFGNVHSKFFAPMSTRMHGKVLSLPYHARVIFEQLIVFSKANFLTNVPGVPKK